MQWKSNDIALEELRQFLSDSASYAGRPPVECIETEFSLVFLAGHDAFKLQKPVKFEFLDCSTAALRKRACEAEVSLNRRLAPSVYLGVEPIRRLKNGSLQIGGDDGDELVDWLVHMRRLDARRTLKNRLESGDEASNSKDIVAAAHYLAEFFAAQAPITARTDAFRANLQAHIDDNQHQLLELDESDASRDQVLRIHSAQRRFLQTHSDLFDSRVLDGRIVDGHGDLRPDHIYIYTSPVVIGCIAFNRDDRISDIIDELAYLGMCCDRLGHPSVSKALFREYEHVSRDPCDAQLIAFYKSYRASERARLAAQRCHQTVAGRKSDWLTEVEDFLALGERYAASLDEPLVLMVGGLMGTGKSTLAHQLKDAFSAEMTSTDAVRLAYFNAPEETLEPDEDRRYGIGKYTPAARLANYKRMIQDAEHILHRNSWLIFDGTFATQEARELAVVFARKHGCQILQVECTCPRDEAIGRIIERANRGNAESEARPEHYDQQAAEAEPPLSSVPLVRVDTTLALAEQQTSVLEAIRGVLV